MSLNFPANPSNGDTYTSGSITYVYQDSPGKWTASTQVNLDTRYVNSSGDTMTGALNVPAAATGTEAPQVQEVVLKAGDTMTGNLTVPSLNSGPLAGLRNALINGSFLVWQRGTGTTGVPAASAFLADRWQVRGTTNTGGTATQSRRIEDNVTKHRYQPSGLTSFSYLRQSIEAQNIRHLAGKQVTISIYASHQPNVTVTRADSSGSLITVVSEAATTLVTGETNRYSVTLTLPDVAYGEITGEGVGLLVDFNYNNAQSPLTDGDYFFWNAQLELGPVATPPEHRPIAAELALCQRYLRSYDVTSSSSSGMLMHHLSNAPSATSASGWQCNIGLSGTMRLVDPTVELAGGNTALTGRAANGGGICTTSAILCRNFPMGLFQLTVTSTSNPSTVTQLRGNASGGKLWLNAEL